MLQFVIAKRLYPEQIRQGFAHTNGINRTSKFSTLKHALGQAKRMKNTYVYVWIEKLNTFASKN